MFKAPHLSYIEVGKIADKVLKTCHPSSTLPIPIENFIEFDFNLHIHPIPDLYKLLFRSGFLSIARKMIYVDKYQYDNFEDKYRFTLAHELGHYVLHEKVYQELNFESEQDFIIWSSDRPPEEIKWLQHQGDWFAGHILVPVEQLEKYCKYILESRRDRYCESESLPGEFWSYASNELADIFKVKPIIVEIRIHMSGLADRLRNYFRKQPVES